MLSHFPSNVNETLVAVRGYLYRHLGTARKQHAAACSLSNEDCGESISHSFEACYCLLTGLMKIVVRTALRYATACTMILFFSAPRSYLDVSWGGGGA